MIRKEKLIFWGAALAVAAIVAYAFFSLNLVKGGRSVISSVELKDMDPANAGINIEVTRPWIGSGKELSFNVGEPDEERDFNRIDLSRCLFQCAQALSERDFSRIYLCNKGSRLYYIPAEDFKRLGRDYRIDDSMNTLALYTRLPQITRTLNDSIAFPANDGVLGSVSDLSDWNTMMSNLLR